MAILRRVFTDVPFQITFLPRVFTDVPFGMAVLRRVFADLPFRFTLLHVFFTRSFPAHHTLPAVLKMGVTFLETVAAKRRHVVVTVCRKYDRTREKNEITGKPR